MSIDKLAKIEVISLARSTGRRQEFARVNRHLDYSFVDAVDGARLSAEAIRESALFSDGLNYTQGAYGCALSHLARWDAAIATGQPVTVVEDDAIFRRDFDAQYAQAARTLPEDWDFILWGWNMDAALGFRFIPGVSPAVALFDQDQMRDGVDRFQQSSERVCFPRLDKCWGIVAYTVSPAGAKKLKDLCFPLRELAVTFPIIDKRYGNSGIDAAMNLAYEAINAYVAFPPAVITKNENGSSTIQRRKSRLSRAFKHVKTGLRKLFQRPGITARR